MQKEIQLCGIGNGLVDYQFEVTDELINQLGIKKGTMTLVDTDVQAQIIHELSKENYNKCSGGSAANTIIAYAKFGGKAAYQTVLGNDENGLFYSNEFKDLGIALSADLLIDNPTGSCLVLITPDSERTMMTALGASSMFNESKIDKSLIERSEWLYIEGYEFSQEASAQAVFNAIETAKKGDVKIALTFSDVFITQLFKENVSEAAKNADLIFCNEQEAYSFTKQSILSDAIAKLSGFAPNLALTLGSQGSYIKWNNVEFRIPAYTTIPVDTTGAGDMFAGAFMYGILNSGDPIKAGHLASYASSKVVSQMGARLNSDHNEIRDHIFNMLANINT